MCKPRISSQGLHTCSSSNPCHNIYPCCQPSPFRIQGLLNFACFLKRTSVTCRLIFLYTSLDCGTKLSLLTASSHRRWSVPEICRLQCLHSLGERRNFQAECRLDHCTVTTLLGNQIFWVLGFRHFPSSYGGTRRVVVPLLTSISSTPVAFFTSSHWLV